MIARLWISTCAIRCDNSRPEVTPSLFIAVPEVRVYTAPDETQFVIFYEGGVVLFPAIINMCYGLRRSSYITR